MKKSNLPLIFEGLTKKNNKKMSNQLSYKSKLYQTSEMKVYGYYKQISKFKQVDG